MTEVARAIKAHRLQWSRTQRQVAETLKISAAYLNDIEHGRRDLSDDRIMKCPDAALRARLVDARVKELQSRAEWLTVTAVTVRRYPMPASERSKTSAPAR